MPPPAVLAFDVFGTIVDWRTSVARALTPVLATIGRTDLSPHALADAWRARYQPKLDEVRRGRRPFVILDTLHREALVELLGEQAIVLDDALLDDLTRAWHRLDAWPDVMAGLGRLRSRYPCVTLSNGHVALLVGIARHAGLNWDAVLGAGVSRAYKPLPQAYLATAESMDVPPGALCLVAAHHSDLAAARACGLQTAYVDRPLEYGGASAPDAHHAQEWDHAVDGLGALADRLGC